MDNTYATEIQIILSEVKLRPKNSSCSNTYLVLVFNHYLLTCSYVMSKLYLEF